MTKTGTLKVTTPSDRERVFDAPRSLVCDVLTTPFHYAWRDPDGADVGMRGVIRDIGTMRSGGAASLA